MKEEATATVMVPPEAGAFAVFGASAAAGCAFEVLEKPVKAAEPRRPASASAAAAAASLPKREAEERGAAEFVFVMMFFPEMEFFRFSVARRRALLLRASGINPSAAAFKRSSMLEASAEK